MIVRRELSPGRMSHGPRSRGSDWRKGANLDIGGNGEKRFDQEKVLSGGSLQEGSGGVVSKISAKNS